MAVPVVSASGRSADTVNIIFRIRWNIKINHQTDSLYIYAPAQYISPYNNNRQCPAFKGPQYCFTLFLLQIQNEKLRLYAFFSEGSVQIFYSFFS